jgi:hypothetical protein
LCQVPRQLNPLEIGLSWLIWLLYSFVNKYQTQGFLKMVCS